MFKRFGLGFAAGYVLGARGGEKRYKQLTELADKLQELPAVRTFTEDGGQAVVEGTRRVAGAIRQRLGEMGTAHGDEMREPAGDDEGEMGEDEDHSGRHVVDEDDAGEDATDEDDAGEDATDEDDAWEDDATDEDDAGEDATDEDDAGESRRGAKGAERPRRTARRSFASSISELAAGALERGKVA